MRPYPAVNVREHFTVMPRIEALAVVHGDRPCTNDDLIRNAAYNWSPMAAEEIRDKTGIEQRRYTHRQPRGDRAAGGAGGPRPRRPGPGGDRRGAGLHVHQHAA